MIMPSITRCGRCSMMKRSLMVPGSLSSALQTTYFSVPGALRTASHLNPVGKSRAAQSGQSGRFQLRDHAVAIAGFNQFPERAVRLRVPIRIRRETGLRVRFNGMCGNSPPPSAINTSASACAAFTLRKDMIVHRNRRRAIALAQAGNISDQRRRSRSCR